MDILRTELVEAQKARTDFIRWKPVFVATPGAVGLGLTTSTALPNAALVLGCIPFVCLYVDMVSCHLSLRIVIIGEFLRGNPGADPLMAQSEAFVGGTRTMAGAGSAPTLNAFALQDTLIPGSTLAINAVVIGHGVLHTEPWIAAAGALGSVLVERVYGRRLDAVRSIRIDGPPA